MINAIKFGDWITWTNHSICLWIVQDVDHRWDIPTQQWVDEVLISRVKELQQGREFLEVVPLNELKYFGKNIPLWVPCSQFDL